MDADPEISYTAIETILNGDVAITEETREAIVNADTWEVKSRLLKYHGNKPSEDELMKINRFLTMDEKKKKKADGLKKR